MSYSWQFFKVFIIFAIFFSNSNAWTSIEKQKDEEETDSLPQDFLFFVNHLDRMVFKREPETTTLQTPTHAPKVIKAVTDLSFKIKTNDKNIQTTKNNVFGDMLMMKLISYYEKKYNVARGNAHFDKMAFSLETITSAPKYSQNPMAYSHWSQKHEIKIPADARDLQHWYQTQEASKKTADPPIRNTPSANVQFQEGFIMQAPTEPAPEVVPEVMSL